MKSFQLDIITPTDITSYESVSYLRIPSFDGLIGIKSRHATAIIGLGVGEIKVSQENEELFFSTSGGFADIKPEGVQLLLETIESSAGIDKQRAEGAFDRAKLRMNEKEIDIDRAHHALLKAKNRLQIFKKK